MKTIKILDKATDFRKWEVFFVEGDEDSIRRYFELRYPHKGIAVLEQLNNMGLFNVTILPEEIEE
jgi:hypothetical protein